MSKAVLSSKQTEWKGLDRISAVVHAMGNIWREMTKDDYGLDGEIEVVTPKPGGGFETAGGIIKVQSKAGESYVRYDSAASFSTPVDQDDLSYWQKCTFPVLFIVYHPKDDKLYFKEVKAYIRNTPGVFAKPYHIRFDKAADEFTADSRASVQEHARVSPNRVAFDQKERLFTNLLPVTALPDTLYHAATRRRNPQAVRDGIKGFVPPFCIVDGKLFSLSDLADERCTLKPFCVGKVGVQPAGAWVGDDDRVNDFIYLLNQLLGILDEEPVADESVVRVYKILNRDFVGFSAATPFKCGFRVNDRWDRTLQPHEIKGRLDIADKQKRIWELVGLFDEQVRSLAQTKPSPDIILLALTQEIEDEAHAVRVTGTFYLNFRRAIKARVMRWGIPVQIILRNTILGKKSRGRKGPLQEKATRAWNFCTAQYYKADGVAWRPTAFQQETCFVGIDFFVARELGNRLTMRSSVAQAFDYLGQGLVLRGDPFEWDEEKEGRSPHLTREGARKLMKATLEEYVRVKQNTPKRVVVHKSSRFWGSDHGDHNELDGFHEGIREVFSGIESDLVTLSRSRVRLFREGAYPPLRGTYCRIGDDAHLLYTTGFTPYLATFPGSYVPEPWQIVEHHGGSSKKDLLREVLELTKMNVNNCSFADGTPITLSFSKKVGEIMKHVPEDESLQTGYKFYM